MTGKILISNNFKHIINRGHKLEGVTTGNIRRTLRGTDKIAWTRDNYKAVVNEETNQVVIIEEIENNTIQVITSYFSTKNQIKNRIKKYNRGE